MVEIRLNIEAIRATLGISRKQFAKELGINVDRYNRLASGRSKMLAEELVKVHEISNVPYDNIFLQK